MKYVSIALSIFISFFTVGCDLTRSDERKLSFKSDLWQAQRNVDKQIKLDNTKNIRARMMEDLKQKLKIGVTKSAISALLGEEDSNKIPYGIEGASALSYRLGKNHQYPSWLLLVFDKNNLLQEVRPYWVDQSVSVYEPEEPTWIERIIDYIMNDNSRIESR